MKEDTEKEIELKYQAPAVFTPARIFADTHLAALITPGSQETIDMQATYYDTAQRGLLRQQIAFRIRCEDGQPVVTLKWGGQAEDGLHTRDELNVAVDEGFLEAPTVEIFRGSRIFDVLEETAGGQTLLPVMTMAYTRRQVQVDTGASISVLSFDTGEIRTPAGQSPIAELEIELYSGDQQDMMRLGSDLAAKYGLTPLDQSKYQRGLALLGLL